MTRAYRRIFNGSRYSWETQGKVPPTTRAVKLRHTPSQTPSYAVTRRHTRPKPLYAATRRQSRYTPLSALAAYDGSGCGEGPPPQAEPSNAVIRRRKRRHTPPYAVRAVIRCQRRHTPPTPSNAVKRRKRRHTPSQTPSNAVIRLRRRWRRMTALVVGGSL